jgi:hypothetical protein
MVSWLLIFGLGFCWEVQEGELSGGTIEGVAVSGR